MQSSTMKAQRLAEEIFKAGKVEEQILHSLILPFCFPKYIKFFSSIEEANNQNTIAEIFVNIFANENYQQLRLLFEQYKKLSGPIDEKLKTQLSGNLLKLTLAIG